MTTLITAGIVGIASAAWLVYRLYQAEQDRLKVEQLKSYIGADAEARKIENDIAVASEAERANPNPDLSRL